MRCGHCKADGVDRNHVIECSARHGGLSARSHRGMVPTLTVLDETLPACRCSGVRAAPSQDCPVHAPVQAVPTPADAAARAQRVIAGNGGQVQAVGGPVPAEPTNPPANPATDKQRAFLRRLAAERAVASDGSDGRSIAEALGDVVEVTIQALSKAEASATIEDWLTLPHATSAAGSPATAQVPEGRYAIAGVDADTGLVFYEVDHGKPGSKWEGFVFVDRLVGAPGDFQTFAVRGQAKANVLQRIAADVQAAARAFGHAHRVCGRCLSPLSDVRSRAAGYGATCAGHLGAAYPTREEALALLAELPPELAEGLDLDE